MMKCLLSMNAVWLINLFVIEKETPAAGFKTSNSLCLPQIGRKAVPHHRTIIAETVFRKLVRGSETANLPSQFLRE